MLTFYNCDFDTTKNLPFKTCVQHGEDCQFKININVGGVSSDMLGNYDWTAVYQDVSCLSVYYTIDAEDVEWNSQTNAVDLYFRHKYDIGAIAYRIFIYGTQGEETTVPALIELGMLPNPIFSASHVDPIPPTIDFSQYNLVNAPWTELSDFQALSAKITEDYYTKTDTNQISVSIMSAVNEIANKKADVDKALPATKENNVWHVDTVPYFSSGLKTDMIWNGSDTEGLEVPDGEGIIATEGYVDSALSGKADKSEVLPVSPSQIYPGGWTIKPEMIDLCADTVEFTNPDAVLYLREGNVMNEYEVVDQIEFELRNYLNLSGGQLAGPLSAPSIDVENIKVGTTLTVDRIQNSDDTEGLEVPNGGQGGGTIATEQFVLDNLPAPPVSSVNGQTGDVMLDAHTVSALPAISSEGSSGTTYRLPISASVIIPDANNSGYTGAIGVDTLVVHRIWNGTFGTGPVYALSVQNGKTSADALARTSDLPPTELWTFELTDGTTITKNVCIY